MAEGAVCILVNINANPARQCGIACELGASSGTGSVGDKPP